MDVDFGDPATSLVPLIVHMEPQSFELITTQVDVPFGGIRAMIADPKAYQAAKSAEKKRQQKDSTGAAPSGGDRSSPSTPPPVFLAPTAAGQPPYPASADVAREGTINPGTGSGEARFAGGLDFVAHYAKRSQQAADHYTHQAWQEAEQPSSGSGWNNWQRGNWKQWNGSSTGQRWGKQKRNPCW